MHKKEVYKYIKPRCPRCGSLNTRAVEEISSVIKCQHDGYKGYWKQFFEGTKERAEVQKLFNEGKLEGDPLLGSVRKPIDDQSEKDIKINDQKSR